MDRQNDTALLIGRLLIAALFLSFGIPLALGGYVGFSKYAANLGMPYPEIMAWAATAIQVAVPVGLILGIFPRLSATVLIVYVIIAAAFAHRYWEYPADQLMNQRNHFLKNIGLIGGLLFYYASGPGAFALGGRSRSDN